MTNAVSSRASFLLASAAIVLLLVALAVPAYLVLPPLVRPSPEGLAISILGALALVLAAATVVLIALGRADEIQGVLSATVPWLPGAFAAAVIGLVLLDHPAATAIALGALLTAAAWLTAGFLFSAHARVENAQPQNFDQLSTRISGISACVGQLATPAAVQAIADPVEQQVAAIAAQQAQDWLASITPHFGPLEARPHRARDWVAGTGYVDLWSRVHELEEALIQLAPMPQLLEWARHDRLRLNGSNLSDGPALTAQLDQAVATLGNAEVPPSARAQARESLRVVRSAINSYRDERWDKICRARNQLLRTMVLTGLTADAALVVGLLAGVEKIPVVGAIMFFLVGAVIGLFARLRRQADATSVVEDYGLGEAQLAVTPVISGLAAIAGVLLTAKILLPATDVVAPASVDDSGKVTAIATSVRTPPALSDIFDLTLNPAGLLVAAVFGLTPKLVLDKLESQGEKYKTDLQASGVTDNAPAKP